MIEEEEKSSDNCDIVGTLGSICQPASQNLVDHQLHNLVSVPVQTKQGKIEEQKKIKSK